jgi:hypothetical protein
MTVNTSLGCESITTWLDSISVTVAPARFAQKRSRSGLIALSLLEMMYQLGFVFQAGVARMSPCSFALRSAAYPSACSAAICELQQEPSAQMPWMKMMVGAVQQS